MATIQYQFYHFKTSTEISAEVQTTILELCLETFPNFLKDKFEEKLRIPLPDGRLKSNFFVIAALHENDWVGFKFGYERAPGLFYSWLGCVRQNFQKQGIATELMRLQHQWCKDQGYDRVQTKTTNLWRSMLLLNIRFGFDIVGTTQRENQLLKIILEKTL